MQALIFCGIQASGKSTFYQQHFFNSHVRISMDLLRTRHREKLFFELCLHTRAQVVVDNTNPTILERQRYLLPAKAAGYACIAYYFQLPLQQALQHNARRSGKAQIPEKGIRGTLRRLQPPAFSEGFDRILLVQPDLTGGFRVAEFHA